MTSESDNRPRHSQGLNTSDPKVLHRSTSDDTKDNAKHPEMTIEYVPSLDKTNVMPVDPDATIELSEFKNRESKQITLGEGTYEIVATLGKGGQGTVMLGHDLRLGNRPVAIKKANANKDGSVNSKANDGLFREATAIASMDHPHIVPIYGLEKDGDSLWFVYKYIKGSNLEEKLDKQTKGAETSIKPKDTAALVSKIASALQAVHDKGFCHRDVKPANILIDEKNCPFLADFGVVMPLKRDPDTDRSSKVAGSVPYMSPEQAAAILGQDREIDQRSDIFSLGIVLHEMLSGGKKLFPGEGEANFAAICKIAKKIASSDPVPPPVNPKGTIPAELRRICMKALAKDPKNRYQSAADMEKDLQAFLDKGKSRTGSAAMGAALLVGALGVGLAARSGVDPQRPVGPSVNAVSSEPQRPPEKALAKALESIRKEIIVPKNDSRPAGTLSDLMLDFFYARGDESWRGQTMEVDGVTIPFSPELHFKLIEINLTRPGQLSIRNYVEGMKQLAEFESYLMTEALSQKPGQDLQFTYGLPQAVWNEWQRSSPEQGTIWIEKLQKARDQIEEVIGFYTDRTQQLADSQGLSR